MNWKLLIGKSLSNIEQAITKSRSKFIRENYPFGRFWLIDVKRIINEAEVIVDAGANVGFVSVDCHYWFPQADIYAFEPISNTFALLQKKVGPIKNIHPIKMALGEHPGFIDILVNRESTTNSLRVTQTHEGIVDKEQIEVARLDQFAAEKNLGKIDILKIDVEGFEFEVLRGAGDFLQNVKCIYLEVGFKREETKVHFSDVEQFMESTGFQLCGFYETRRNWADKRLLWYSNFLYIRKDILETEGQ